METKHTGSCLCKAIQFEISGALEGIQCCHCGDCRKAQGSAFAANIPVKVDCIKWISGKDELKSYESNPGKQRVFCQTCGSPIYSKKVELPGIVRIRAGILDEPIQAKPAFHFFVESKASWDTLPNDSIVRYQTRPGGETM